MSLDDRLQPPRSTEDILDALGISYSLFVPSSDGLPAHPRPLSSDLDPDTMNDPAMD